MCGYPLSEDKEANKKYKYSLDHYTFNVPIPFDIDNEALEMVPHYAFVSKAAKAYICSHCGTYHEYKKEDFQETNQSVCTNCGHKISLHRLRSNTNYYKLRKIVQIDFLNKYKDNILFQRFYFVIEINADSKRETITVKDENRRSMIIGDEFVQLKWHYVYNNGFDYKRQWVFGSNTDSCSDYYKDYHLVNVKSYRKLFSNTLIEKTQLSEFVNTRNIESHTVMKLASLAIKYPWIEYLWKGNMRELYKDIVYGNANMSVIRPKMIMHHRKQIQRLNANSPMAEIIRYGERHRMTLLPDEFVKQFNDWYRKNRFIEVWKSQGNNQELIKYAIKQGVDKVNSYYEDYIRMTKDIHGDGELPSNLVFPKDLKKAHDDMASKHRKIEVAKKNKKFEKAMEDKLQLAFEDRKFGLAIVVPTKATDLVDESKCLIHCVSSYIDNVVKGSTTILFVRKIEKPDEPFVTVEYKDGKITQARGYNNHNPEKDVMEFLDVWKKNVKPMEGARA